MTVPPNVAVLLLILLCTPPGPATAQVPETCADLPPNLIVRDGYAPHVRRLIVRSPTIRAQCRALAATPRAIVVVRLPQGPRLLDCRARATIRRTAAGTIRAVIEIPPVSGDFAELLAHELEHVMEQIDGIDLAARAGDGRSGVRRGRQGAFETDRAQRAGLAAAREVFMSARWTGQADTLPVAAVVGALAQRGFQLRVSDATFAERSRVLPFAHGATGLPVDVVLAGPGLEDAFFTRITRHSIDGVEVPVADVTDLVVMKVLAGRPKDVEDVITLLRVQHDRIDVDRARAALQQLEAALGQSDLLQWPVWPWSVFVDTFRKDGAVRLVLDEGKTIRRNGGLVPAPRL